MAVLCQSLTSGWFQCFEVTLSVESSPAALERKCLKAIQSLNVYIHVGGVIKHHTEKHVVVPYQSYCGSDISNVIAVYCNM